jgi:hypothetical protein
MSEFLIEDGIPMPSKRSASKYPWAECNPGQSFLVPCNEDQVATRMSGLTSSAKKFYAKQGLPFRARSRAVEGGVRVWIEVLPDEAEVTEAAPKGKGKGKGK